MSENHQDADGDINLILENNKRIRRSFDPHICSVELKPKTNNPTDGYGLAISLQLGSEMVSLRIGEEVLDFRFEIFKAEIVINNTACRFDPLHERETVTRIPVTLNPLGENDERNKTSRFKIDSGKMLESVTGGKVEFEQTTEGKAPTKVEAWFEITFLGDDTIQIVSKGPKAVRLEGALLDEVVGWYVIPNPKLDSGVIARARIREDWIRLVDLRTGSTATGWVDKLAKLLSSSDDERAERRKAFHTLITHLVAVGMQARNDTGDATLAMDTVIVRPITDTITKLSRDEISNLLSLDDRMVKKFLNSKNGSEKSILLEAGVPQERLEGISFDESQNEIEDDIIDPELQRSEDILRSYLQSIDVTYLNSSNFPFQNFARALGFSIRRLRTIDVIQNSGLSEDELQQSGVLLDRESAYHILVRETYLEVPEVQDALNSIARMERSGLTTLGALIHALFGLQVFQKIATNAEKMVFNHNSISVQTTSGTLTVGYNIAR